jgi:hypothetical protein
MMNMNAKDKCRNAWLRSRDAAYRLPLGSDHCRTAAFYAWLRAATRFARAASWAESRAEFRSYLREAGYSVREALRGADCGKY